MKKALTLMALAALSFAWPLAAAAQSLAPVPRIGVLRFAGMLEGDAAFSESFRQGLRELGYIEGKNIAVEWRFAEGRSDRVTTFARELVRLRVDLIVASGTPAVEAARAATRKIPIVMASVGDAVGSGFVANLARPDGNITGMSLNLPGAAGRQLEWIKQLLPGVTRGAFLASARDPAARLLAEATERAGGRLGIRIQVLPIDSAAAVDAAFATMRREQVGVLIVPPVVPEGLERIVELAGRSRLPSVSWLKGFAEGGVLMTYGPDQREIWRHAAIYVDKILRGAKPRDLAVTEPTKHLLAINLKTAKTLGLTVPPAILSRADEVIQ